MKLSDFLVPQLVSGAVEVAGKEELLDKVSASLAAVCELSPAQIATALKARERLSSTAVGGGVAIPHAKFAGLSAIHLAVIRSARPLPFDAPDGQPVTICFVVISPLSMTGEHLKLLAHIATVLRRKNFKNRLLTVENDQLYQLIVAEDGEP